MNIVILMSLIWFKTIEIDIIQVQVPTTQSLQSGYYDLKNEFLVKEQEKLSWKFFLIQNQIDFLK